MILWELPLEKCLLVIVQEFVKAVIAYEKKLSCSASIPKSVKLDQEIEKKRKVIVRSFSIARNMYSSGGGKVSGQESELQVGAEFLEVSWKFISNYNNSILMQLDNCCEMKAVKTFGASQF